MGRKDIVKNPPLILLQQGVADWAKAHRVLGFSLFTDLKIGAIELSLTY